MILAKVSSPTDRQRNFYPPELKIGDKVSVRYEGNIVLSCIKISYSEVLCIQLFLPLSLIDGTDFTVFFLKLKQKSNQEDFMDEEEL